MSTRKDSIITFCWRNLSVLCLAVMAALALTGCPEDEFDPNTWIKKLDDANEVERAVTQLERLGDKRLLLVPEATLCVACQRDFERTDSRRFIASQSPELNPVRGDGSLETVEPFEEDYDALAEYRIDTLTDEDPDENETEVPSEGHKESKDS